MGWVPHWADGLVSSLTSGPWGTMLQGHSVHLPLTLTRTLSSGPWDTMRDHRVHLLEFDGQLLQAPDSTLHITTHSCRAHSNVPTQYPHS